MNGACGSGSLSLSWENVANVIDYATNAGIIVETVFSGGWSAAGPDQAELAAERAMSSAMRRAARIEQLEANRAAGKAGEAATRARLGDNIAGEQVTFKTSSGKRARADFVTKQREVIETKTGNARLSSGQRQLMRDIDSGSPVTPLGKNAAKAGLEPGTPSKMKSCSVDRC
jgi:hypothetical protein